MYRRLLVNLVLLSIAFSSFSQNKNANTLLWRISGNELQRPSYLFGTMHLTDKRLFNFDDSLYHALEVTDGTAIEVNPDEMMTYTLNKALEGIDKGRNLKDILNEKDYKKYSEALAKKLNKPASEITEKDLALYLTQKYLAESSVYDMTADEDYDVKTVKFIAEKIADYNSKKYKFYLFKVTFEDAGSYFCIAGGYDVAGKLVDPKEDIGSIYYKDEFDAAKLNEQFQAWLKGIKKDE